MADGDDELDIELEPDPVEPEDIADPDEPEPEAATGGDGEKPPVETAPVTDREPDRQPSRRDTRIQTLAEEARQAKADLAETRRRLDDLSRQMTQPRPPSESPEQRAARFALMTPQEQMSETLRESEQRTVALVQQVQLQTADATDRATFQSKYAAKPEFLQKWGPKVEALRAEALASGRGYIERDVALRHLIGGAAIERLLSKEAKQETRQAQRRVQAQRTRPTNSGSDTSSQRRQQQTLERRLEDVQI